jgi:3-hydroxyisobutyrate dehydrogenase-like beta-hydroxyacid dehydrogenase
MGSAVGSALRKGGHVVLWASSGRSPATVERAKRARLDDVRTVAEVVAQAEAIVSVCPPHAATDVARSVAGFSGVFVDANAVSPATARSIATEIESGSGRFVDGAIVGPPPSAEGTTRLYLSGADAAQVARLFDGTPLDACVLGPEAGAASALKMVYPAWTKGSAAMLLAILELARAQNVESPLLHEWRLSLPELPDACERAARAAEAKGWRWVAEMEEIAATFAAADLPDGFHQAAAEIFRGFSVNREQSRDSPRRR